MANTNKKRANTIGSISYIKDKNLYKGRISLGTDETGKRIRKTFYGKTKEEVTEKVLEYKLSELKKNDSQETQNNAPKSKKEVLKEVNNTTSKPKNKFSSENLPENNQTIYTLINSIVEKKLNLNIIQDTTSYRILETLKTLKKIYDIPIQLIDEETLTTYFAYITKYSSSMIEKICIMLNQAFREAIRLNIIIKNPMEYVMKPKSKKAPKKIRAMSIDEEKELVKILSTEDVLYSQQLLISLFTGMRMGEINALHVDDIDMNKNIIHINKTIGKGKNGNPVLHTTTKTEAGSRDIPLPNEIKYIFEEMFTVRKSGPIFLHKDSLISASQVYSVFRRTMNKYKFVDKSIRGTVAVHSCRHTYATRCIEGGMQPKVLQTLLGHTDITVTMNTYCDAFDKYKDESIKSAENYLKNIGISLS